MSASIKPRLAGRQPSSSRWGAPGEDLAGANWHLQARPPRRGGLMVNARWHLRVALE